MFIRFDGTNTNILADAFTDGANGSGNIEVEFVSQDQARLVNLDTGVTFEVSGFVSDDSGSSFHVSEMEFYQNGVYQALVQYPGWTFQEFLDALNKITANGDYGPLGALINEESQGTSFIEIDARGALAALDMSTPFWNEILPLITGWVEIFGSDFDDVLRGGPSSDFIEPGLGDDTVSPGSNQFGGDGILGSSGNDVFEFGAVSPETFSFLDYSGVPDPITVSINSYENTGSVLGNGFVDTMVDVRNALSADGLGIDATRGDDTFNVVAEDQMSVFLIAYEGNDTFNITLDTDDTQSSQSGDFPSGYDVFITMNTGALASASEGVVANLETGVIANDGHGYIDQINFLGNGTPRLQFQTTEHDDYVIGSDRGETYRLLAGNDTLEANGGIDILRYDRFGFEAVTVNLKSGIATGIWSELEFLHDFSGIEYVSGSRDDNDSITGDGGDNRFWGRGGDDTLTGGAGRDTLHGEDGDDLLNGGTQNDRLWGASGNDTLLAGADDDLARGGTGNDSIRGGLGDDTLIGGNGADKMHGREGNDRLAGERGTDVLHGDAGRDTLDGGDGADRAYGGSGNDSILGGAGNDTLFGGTGADTIFGGTLHDEVNGGGARDVLRGGAGDDTLNGGNGDDKLKGGDGNDLFVFSNGTDRVVDFGADSAQDRVDLSGASAIVDFADLEANHLTETDGDAVISDDNGNNIILIGVSKDELDANDFLF